MLTFSMCCKPVDRGKLHDKAGKIYLLFIPVYFYIQIFAVYFLALTRNHHVKPMYLLFQNSSSFTAQHFWIENAADNGILISDSNNSIWDEVPPQGSRAESEGDRYIWECERICIEGLDKEKDWCSLCSSRYHIAIFPLVKKCANTQ